MEIPAKLVKELRDKTGAGMMDCKRALIETNGSLSAAEEFLRKKGLTDAAKKSVRTAADGIIAINLSANGKCASIIEINSETDFVARNEKFQELASGIAEVALTNDSLNEIILAKFPGSDRNIGDEINNLISLIGENINLRRIKNISVENGIVATYVHGAVKPSMGKIGVAVAIKIDGVFDKTKIEEFGKKLAMHIAAANPIYLCSKCVPQNVIDKERNIIIAQAKDMGKSAEIADKMADGRVKKFLEETVFYEQIFVIDGKTKIKDVVDGFNKENGVNISISEFIKFVLGEGIEKQETNFAEEVQAFMK